MSSPVRQLVPSRRGGCSPSAIGEGKREGEKRGEEREGRIDLTPFFCSIRRSYVNHKVAKPRKEKEGKREEG